MKLHNILQKRKYLIRIYIIVLTAMFTLIIAFSGIIYYQQGKSLVSNEINNGKKMLIPMANNIRNIDDIVHSICLTNFYSTDIKALMYLKDKDSFIEINAIDRLKRSVIATNFFVRSVYIYNNNRKIYFSTANPTQMNDKYLEDKIRSMSSVPVLKPILRNIEETDSNGNVKNEKVITYFFYNQTDEHGNMNGAVIININLEWLFSSIKEISKVDKDNNDLIIMMDNNGEIISEDSAKHSYPEGMDALLKSFRSIGTNESDNSVGTSTNILNGKKYLITYVKLPKSEWVIFKIRQYDEIYSYINSLRALIIIMAMVFIILSLALTIGISGVIYKPVVDIVNQVRNVYPAGPDRNEINDEISLIKNNISSSKEKLDRLYAEKNSNSRIIKLYFIMRLLLESAAFSKEELLSGFSEHGISLNLDRKLAVCVFEMNKYQAFKNMFDEEARKLIKLSIVKIVSEAISSAYTCEAIDTREDQITVILNAGEQDSSFHAALECILEQINKNVLDLCKFSLYASISHSFENYSGITPMHQKASTNLSYHYVLGLRGLITPGKVVHNDKNTSRFNFETEERLLEMIKKGDLNQAEKMLITIFNELKEGNCNDAMFYTAHLTNSLRVLFFEINETRPEPININRLLSLNSLQEMETIDDLCGHMMGILAKLKGTSESIRNEKQTMIADIIKDIINNNYNNPALCASFIADMLKLTPTHIGRLFNECTSMSIPEYVNEVRMQKALDWLQNTRFSIDEIMLKVGIVNRGYFYKLFKNKYGSSPREFIYN